MEKIIKNNRTDSLRSFWLFIRYLFVIQCLVSISICGIFVSAVGAETIGQPGLVPTISGPDTACMASGVYEYSTEPGMTDYNWNISQEGAIISGTGTNSIVVSWLQAGAGSVTVTYANASSPASMMVSVFPVILPVITVVPDNNQVCSGTPVAFVAVLLNGGTQPVLQWYVNDVSVGSNSNVFTYVPSNGDVVNCALTSNAVCVASTTVVSLPVTMTVEPLQQSGLFIYASSNPVCQGTFVAFNALPQNGGTAPAYQWKVNNMPVGSSNPVFSYIPSNGDLIMCAMTSSLPCVLQNPAISNTVIMTVGTSQPVSVYVTASASPVCQGNSVTLSAIPQNGGTSPQYLWKVNDSPVGSGSSSYTYLPADGDVVACMLTSNTSCATGNPAVSAPVIMNVNQVTQVTVSVQPSSNPVCQGMAVTFVASPGNGGMSPIFQWMLNGFPVGDNNATYTYIPANGDAVTCKLYSSMPCQSAYPAISNTVNMTVNPNNPVSVSISSSANPVCVASSVTITANPFNEGSSPVFEWKVNGNTVGSSGLSYSFIPNNGDLVVCMMTSNATCAPSAPVSSNTIAMTVSPHLPASVSISPSLNPVCQNIQVVYSASAMNGGTSPAYQWQVNSVNAGLNNAVFTYAPQQGDLVSCVMTSNLACVSGSPASSNIVAMTVIPSSGVPVGATITPSANPSCFGQQVNFTAIVTNGGTAPVYAWTVNGLDVGTNSPTYSYIPSNGDFVRCWVTSDLTCATNNPAGSNEISMTVNPILPVSVTIINSANPSCVGANVTYTANAVNKGSSPVYQWKVDGNVVGLNQNTLVYAPISGNVISCKVTSSLGCTTGNPSTSNSITANVQPVLPVTISISTLTNPSCTGSPVTYHAAITNGGTSPVYQWRLNGGTTGSNSATLIFVPATGDVITCKVSSNAICYTGNKIVTSAPITMTVSPELAPVVNITTVSNPFCEGSTVTFTAVPTNGGTLPVYQWRVNCMPVATNNPVFTYTPLLDDYVTCQMTSNLSCAILNPCKSNGISMRRNEGTPAGIQISASVNPVCPGSIVSFTAVVVNGGGSPGYQWKVNGNIVGSSSPQFEYIPANGDVITCKLVSNAACVSGSPALSNPVTMTVSPSLPANITISTQTEEFCPGTAVNFSAVANNGGPDPVFQWKISGMNAGINSPDFTFFPVTGDVVSCNLTSNASCISGQNPVFSNQVALQSGSGIPVSISIAAISNTVCQGTAVTFTATYSGAGNSPIFNWKVNGIATGTNNPVHTYSPANGDVVTCTLTSSLACAATPSVTSNAVTLSVDALMPVSVSITSSVNPCCVGSPVTFNAIVQNGGSAPVYQWLVNCVNVGPNSPAYTYIPVNGDVVVCRVLSNAQCAAENPAVSNNINMVVLPIQPASVTVVPSFNPFCVGNPITFTASPVNGGLPPAYQWQVNHVNVGPNAAVFTYPPADGDTVACIMTSSAVCVSGNPALSVPIIMTGISVLPVTISITVSANSICLNTTVMFTATSTNGGNTPQYQWKVNGNNVGANTNTYQYQPAIGDVVSCQFTTSLSCATPNPAMSNSINMIVFPQAPVSASITASQNPVCQGTPVTYTATINNGGTNPVYRWKVNNLLVGASTPSYTYMPVNGDIVTCTLNSNAICRTGSPATSNAIAMTVNPHTPASLSVAPSANPVCAGSPVVFSATPSNGGTAPIYQWKVNGLNSGTNSPVFTYSPVNGDIVNCEMISNSSCTPILNAISNSLTMTVSPIQPVSVTVLPSVNPVCLNSNVTYAAIAINGGAAPQFQWKVNGFVVGSNSAAYSYVPDNGDVITCKLTSGMACTSGNPAFSPPVAMTVSVSLPVSVSVSSFANTSCQGQTVSYSAAPVNGGVSPAYQWMVNGINVGANSIIYSYVPANGDYVSCQLTSDFYCATENPALSAPVVAIVNPNLPIAISIVSSSNPVCSGTLVSFNATSVNGGISPVYEWKVNGVNAGSNSPAFAYIAVHGDTVTCELTSGVACPASNPVISNSIVMHVVQPVPVSVAVSASQNPVCQGNQVTFLATSINGGYNPVFQWMVNGSNVGTAQPSYNYSPADGDVVVCTLSSNASCASAVPVQSEPVIMSVGSEFPVSVIIQASSNPVCLGQPVTYGASVVNGGISPSFQWLVNGINVGTNSPVLNFTPSEGDIISCLATSDFSCATNNPAISNLVVMSVVQAIPAGISISSSANPVCLGSTVIFTAFATNAGPSPVFHWKVNGVSVGGNTAVHAYIPANGDVVTCELTETGPCSPVNPPVSNQVVMTVSLDLPVGINISASASQVCSGTAVSFTAVATNGGSTPLYQWKVNGSIVGLNSPAYTYTPASGDMVQCIFTSALSCASGNPASSNIIAMTVNSPQQVSVAISSTPANPICAGSTVQMTATPVNGGTNPVYQWYLNGNAVGGNQPTCNFTPSNGDQVYVSLVSNLFCSYGSPAVSGTTAILVNDPMTVNVSAAVNQNDICEGTQVTFTATPVNGGIPLYQWYLNGLPVGANQPTYMCTPANGDVVHVTMTSSVACVSNPTASSNVITMIVNEVVPVNVSIAGDQNPGCQGSPVSFSAFPVNGGASPVYQWKVNGNPIGGNTPEFSYIPADGDMVQCVLTSGLSCTVGNPASSNIIVLTVNVPQPVSVAISQDPAGAICAGTTVVMTATPANGGSSPSYEWFKNGIAVGSSQPTYSFTPLNGDQLYVSVNSSLACTYGSPAVSGTMTLVVNDPLPVSVSAVVDQNNVCAGTPVIFTATPVNGGVPFYQWYLNGLPAGMNQPTYACIPANGDLVQVSMTSSLSCVNMQTVSSGEITMMVNSLLPVNVAIECDQNPVCQGSPVVLTALPVNGGLYPVYQWKVNGTPVGTGSPTYSYIPDQGDLVQCSLTSGLSCITGNPASSNIIAMTVNPLQPVSVTVTQDPAGALCAGTSVVMTATPVNGGTNPAYQWYKNGNAIGNNQPTFSFTPSNGDQVYVSVASNFICSVGSPAVSATIVMVVNDPLPVSVSAVVNQNNICEGTQVTFSATPVNGGVPVYQWYLNGLPVGVNQPTYTCTPANGDLVYVTMTSSLPCVNMMTVSSDVITMMVNSMAPVNVSIASNQNPVCQGSPVTLTATPVNGGPSPEYQWRVNGNPAGTNSPTYSYVPLDGDLVQCILTSGLSCASGNPASSNIIAMTVTAPQPVSVVVSPDPAGAVCNGTTVLMTATPVNGGTNPLYQWYKNGNAVGSNQPTYSFTPSDGDQVYVSITSSLSCPYGSPSVSQTLTMAVNEPLPVSVSVVANHNNVCEGSPVTFTAAPVNGGVPVYQWHVNGVPAGFNQPTFDFTPSNGDLVDVTMTGSLTCVTMQTASSNIISMIVNEMLPAIVSIAGDLNPVCEGTTVTFTATPVNGGNPVYQWFVNGTPAGINQNLFSYVPIDGDQIYVQMSSSLACVTVPVALSDSINMMVENLLQASVTIVESQNNICEGATVVFTATGVNGGVPLYQWYKNDLPVGDNAGQYSCVPATGDRIFVEMTSSLMCVTAAKATSNVMSTVVKPNPVAAQSVAGTSVVCAGTTGVNFSVLPVTWATSYTWNLPEGVTVASGEHENTITLNFGTTSLSGVITVCGSNACGNGPSSPAMQVNVLPIPETPYVTLEGNTLTSTSPAGNQWYFESVPIPDSAGQTISPVQPGWYWSSVAGNGCSSDTSNHVYFDGVFPGPITDEPGFWVYPVPNDGHFTVAISLPEEDVFDVTVYNSLGVQLYQIPGIVVKDKFKQVIDLRHSVSKGMFTVVFKCDDYQVVKKALIYNFK